MSNFKNKNFNTEYVLTADGYNKLKADVEAFERKLKEIGIKKGAAAVVDLPINSEKVEIGTTVRILILKNNTEQSFTITDPEMTDPNKNKISYQSPVGSKLMGKKSNEMVDLPIGKAKILSTNIKL